MALLPDPGDTAVFVSVLVVPLAVQWWAVWYPGAEPGGGSYIAQRMLAARDEGHALNATLWFNIAHYALRPWPWILVALASMLVFPTLDDIAVALPHVDQHLIGNDIAYPAMLTLLPHGLLGLLVASLASAYVSTMSTHLNWGASYLVHDLYRRFLRPDARERELVRVSRLVTVALMACAAVFTLFIDTAGEGFRLLLSFGAGTGLIYLLRWYWWRVTAWSEIAAMVVSFATTLAIHLLRGRGVLNLTNDGALLWTVGMTTVVWLAVAVFGPATDPRTLRSFVRRVRPAGPGWRGFRTPDQGPPDPLPQALLAWSLGCLCIYGLLLATGSLLLGHPLRGLLLFLLAVTAGAGLARLRSGSRFTARRG
jgi:Na+/proline symporter